MTVEVVLIPSPFAQLRDIRLGLSVIGCPARKDDFSSLREKVGLREWELALDPLKTEILLPIIRAAIYDT
jgi:hypothetical protein